LTAWCKERLTKRSQLAYVVKLVLRWSRSLRVFYNFPIVPTWQFASQSLGYLNISKWGLKSYCSRVLRSPTGDPVGGPFFIFRSHATRLKYGMLLFLSPFSFSRRRAEAGRSSAPRGSAAARGPPPLSPAMGGGRTQE
jgi:hypothetical protein